MGKSTKLYTAYSAKSFLADSKFYIPRPKGTSIGT